MKRAICFAALAVSVSALVAQPGFDAVSVKMHTAGSAEEPRNGPWVQTSPGGVTMRNARLVWCLGWAYGLPDSLISGPDWINSERYDIAAKTAGPVPVGQLKTMMQALLTERFKLVLRRETREMPVAVLVPGKNGPRNLQTAVGGAADGPRPVGAGKGIQSLAYRNVTMAEFAVRLGAPPPVGVGEMVVDGTGLAGGFDITVKLDPARFTGGEFSEFLEGALDEQFGLRVERRKKGVEVLVVEKGNRVPTEN
jgi:uncharacterized protein (TIGR03435 family)